MEPARSLPSTTPSTSLHPPVTTQDVSTEVISAQQDPVLLNKNRDSDYFLPLFFKDQIVDPHTGLLAKKYCDKNLTLIRNSKDFQNRVRDFIKTHPHVIKSKEGSTLVSYTLHDRFVNECELEHKKCEGQSFIISGQVVDNLIGPDLLREAFETIFILDVKGTYVSEDKWKKLFHAHCSRAAKIFVSSQHLTETNNTIPVSALAKVRVPQPHRSRERNAIFEALLQCIHHKNPRGTKYSEIEFCQDPPVLWRSGSVSKVREENYLKIKVTYQNNEDFTVELLPDINEVQALFSRVLNWHTGNVNLFRMFYDVTLYGHSRVEEKVLSKKWEDFISKCRSLNKLEGTRKNSHQYIAENVIEIFETFSVSQNCDELVALCHNITLSIRRFFRDHSPMNTFFWQHMKAYIVNRSKRDPSFNPTAALPSNELSTEQIMTLIYFSAFYHITSTQYSQHEMSVELTSSGSDLFLQVSFLPQKNYITFMIDKDIFLESLQVIIENNKIFSFRKALLSLLLTDLSDEHTTPPQLPKQRNIDNQLLQLLAEGCYENYYLGFILAYQVYADTADKERNKEIMEKIIDLIPTILFQSFVYDDFPHCWKRLTKLFAHHPLLKVLENEELKEALSREYSRWKASPSSFYSLQFLYLEALSRCKEVSLYSLAMKPLKTLYSRDTPLTIIDSSEEVEFLVYLSNILKNFMENAPTLGRNFIYSLMGSKGLKSSYRIAMLLFVVETLRSKPENKKISIKDSVHHLKNLLAEILKESEEKLSFPIDSFPVFILILRNAKQEELLELLSLFIVVHDNFLTDTLQLLDPVKFTWPFIYLLFKSHDSKMCALAEKLLSDLIQAGIFPSDEDEQDNADLIALINYFKKDAETAFIFWRILNKNVAKTPDKNFKEVSHSLISQLISSPSCSKALTILESVNYLAVVSSDQQQILLQKTLKSILTHILSAESITLDIFLKEMMHLLSGIGSIKNHEEKIKLLESTLAMIVSFLMLNKNNEFNIKCIFGLMKTFGNLYVYENCPKSHYANFFWNLHKLIILPESHGSLADGALDFMLTLFKEARMKNSRICRELTILFERLYSLNRKDEKFKLTAKAVLCHMCESDILYLYDNLGNKPHPEDTGITVIEKRLLKPHKQLFIIENAVIETSEGCVAATSRLITLLDHLKNKKWDPYYDLLCTNFIRALDPLCYTFYQKYIIPILTNQSLSKDLSIIFDCLLGAYIRLLEINSEVLLDPDVSMHLKNQCVMKSIVILGGIDISKARYENLDKLLERLIKHLPYNSLFTNVVVDSVVKGLRRISITGSFKKPEFKLSGTAETGIYTTLLIKWISGTAKTPGDFDVIRAALLKSYEELSFTPKPDYFLPIIDKLKGDALKRLN